MRKLKKVIAVILLIVSFFVIYFLQSNFFTWFTIARVQPNLFIIFVLFIGLFTGKKLGLILGIIFGFYIDIVIGRQIGISGIMLGIIGLAGEYLDKNFSKESKITIILMIISSTIVFELGSYLFSLITLDINMEIISFIKILFIETLYNVIITIIIYPLIQKLGHILEETFKTRNILTRYF
jgi:rod shape-determining protein MreD